MSADHEHAYEIVRTTPSWWRRLLGAQSTLYHRCSVCLITIDEAIAELDARVAATMARLAAAQQGLEAVAATLTTPPCCGDDTCVDEHG